MSVKAVLHLLWLRLLQLSFVKKVVNFFITRMRPVFIVGCGHSGTSVTLAMLGNHSNLYAVPFESSLMYARYDEETFYKAMAWNLKALMQGKRR
jgi:hypothetical protein